MKLPCKFIIWAIFFFLISTEGIGQVQLKKTIAPQFDSIFPGVKLLKKNIKVKEISLLFNTTRSHSIVDTGFRTKEAIVGTEINLALTTKDGYFISGNNVDYWILPFKVTGATELGFSFQNFEIGDEAEIYLVNHDNTIISGPILKEKFDFTKTKIISLRVPTLELATVIIKGAKQRKIKKDISFSITRLYADNSVPYPFSSKAFQTGFTGCMPNIQCFPQKSNVSRSVAKIYVARVMVHIHKAQERLFQMKMATEKHIC